MPFRKKALYYGLMLLLTLLALEGMARLAYYAAYGQGYGGGGPTNRPVNSTPLNSPGALPAEVAAKLADPIVRTIRRHPFYGFYVPLYGHSVDSSSHPLNAMPPLPRREDRVLIGLLGGSVAEDSKLYIQRALRRYFAANAILPKQPVIIDLTLGAAKQPQQTIIVANTLLLGGEFDLIVNLDGFNEIVGSAGWNRGFFPFFPAHWDLQAGLTGAELSLAGRIGVLRREQSRLAALRETSPLRRSALFGLVNRYRQERTAAAIIRLNHELTGIKSAYSLEKHGPGGWAEEAAAFAEAARVWYRGSLALSRLAELAGADYYQFLQPNQYVPDSKPLSAEEWDLYDPSLPQKPLVEQGYPLLRAFCRDLQNQDIPCFDLTGIFADHPETLYNDDCCHLNARGNQLLAAAVVRRLEPALLRLGGASPPWPVPGGNAAGRPPDFQVSLHADSKQLRYVRADCAPVDVESPFFLHLTPRDPAALPPRRREQGFDNRVFSFAEVDGKFAREQCSVQFPLPDYPIAALRTGQYVPELGDLWSVELIIPVAPAQLRADYAALSAIEPMARDYFDLYDLDNQLIYLRENCAAADTAAPFFLHIIPQEITDLPADRRDAGFAHAGFEFIRQGGHFDGKCLATVPLPEYPIKGMRTGQHLTGQDAPLWAVELIAVSDYTQLRADYMALAATEPAARSYFDLYRRDNRLFYLRETCAAADTADPFFLHIVPDNPADLPEDRRAAGFAHGGFEFVRQGGHFDGKCLASVALPDYPIKEMRTGQYVPGQGDLWSVRLMAAP